MAGTGEEERAKARGAWKLAARPLRAGAEENLSRTTTAEERLAMMWPLALAAWSLSGAPVAACPRSQAPGKLIRGDRR